MLSTGKRSATLRAIAPLDGLVLDPREIDPVSTGQSVARSALWLT